MEAVGPIPRPTEEVGKLAAALCKAQAKFTNPAKTKIVHAGQKKYAFAPLPEILDQVRPILADNGIAILQMVCHGGIDTRLIHESGQSVGAVYPMNAISDPQAMGSAITYARRYALCAMLGIAGDDDDDAIAAEAAEDSAEIARKEAARLKIEEMKAKGKIKSAYTGEVLAPGQSATPADTAPTVEPPKAEVKPTRTPKPTKPPVNPAAVDTTGIQPTLAALMEAAGISADELKAYYVGRGHMPSTVEPANLPADYITSMTASSNWSKAVAAIKANRK